MVTAAVLAMANVAGDDRALAERVCTACTDGLDIDGAAISLLTATAQRETVFASDPTADLLEELQFSLGEGPCVEAAATSRPVLIPDIGDSGDACRWPVYADAVAEQAGIRAVFAIPLQWGTIHVGVLDLYRRTPGSLSQDQLHDALRTADVATLMILGIRTSHPQMHPWDESWGRRAEVHQATGMVVAQLGISAADAFARLRAYAFAEQRMLGNVARDVVDRRLTFTDGSDLG